MAKESNAKTGRRRKIGRKKQKAGDVDSGAIKVETSLILPKWLEPVLAQVGIALICAVFLVPIWLLFTLIAIAGLVFACVRFWEDNESLLVGAHLLRVKESAVTGFRYFIPCLLVLIPGFILAFVFDFVLSLGVEGLERLATADQIKVHVPKIVEREWYDLWRLVSSTKEITTTEVNLMEKGLHVRATAGAARNLLVLINTYGWFFMGYVTLRCYFFFWSRAFVGHGGKVIMRLAKYSCKSPNISATI